MQMWLVRELASNWMSLAGQTAMSVVAPRRTRLRRTMILGESARCALPWTRLDSLIPADLPDTHTLTLKAIRADVHSCSFHELATLAIISRWIAPDKALEIGTYDGRSGLAIAANMPQAGRLWTMNLPPDYAGENGQLKYDEKIAFKVESGVRFKPMPEAARITQVFGDSTRFDFGTLVNDPAKPGPFQYIFVDGGHASDIVLKDTQSALSIIDKSRGVLLWHDATRFGVRPALEKLCKEGLPISLIIGTTIAIVMFKDGQPVKLPY